MRRINILVFFILITIGAYAQDSLRFSRTTYSFTVLDTDNFTISDSIYNIGSGPFTDSIAFGIAANSQSDTTNSTALPTIPSNDTIYPNHANYKTVIFTIDTPPHFIIGPNTIVIWPIIYHQGFPTAASVDSIYINVIYDTIHTGILESPLLRIYIYQTPGHLNINFGDAGNLVQQVRICDMLGQGIYSGSPDQSRNMPTGSWAAGTYVCEISTLGGQRRTIKFILQ